MPTPARASDSRRTPTRAARCSSYIVDVVETAALARVRLDGMRYALVVVDWRLPDDDGIEIADVAANTARPP